MKMHASNGHVRSTRAGGRGQMRRTCCVFAVKQQHNGRDGKPRRAATSRQRAVAETPARLRVPEHDASTGATPLSVPLSLCVSSPALLLNHMAERYTCFSRILMEFVDNSIDDAERWFEPEAVVLGSSSDEVVDDAFGTNNLRTNVDIAASSSSGTLSSSGSYSRPVHIVVTIDATTNSVHVMDNGGGMDAATLARVVCRVGESRKRGQAFVNGQFGFGMQAFRAAAEELTVTSRNEDGGPLHSIRISRGNVEGFEVVEVEPRRGAPGLLGVDGGTGTAITIGGIDEQWRDGLIARDIADEIEEHFERILARKGIEVVVTQVGTKSDEHHNNTMGDTTSNVDDDDAAHLHVAVPDWATFAYAGGAAAGGGGGGDYDGNENASSSLVVTKCIVCQPFAYDDPSMGVLVQHKASFVWPPASATSRRLKTTPQRINVCLVVTKKEVSKRRFRPRFFVNGRRISEVAKTPSFAAVTSNRWSVWESPQVIGYIDVAGGGMDGALQPVITRDEFKRTKGRRAAFEAIADACEDVLSQALDSVSTEQTSRRLGALNVLLNDCLTSVARTSQNARRAAQSRGRDAPSDDATETSDDDAMVHGTHGKDAADGSDTRDSLESAVDVALSSSLRDTNECESGCSDDRHALSSLSSPSSSQDSDTAPSVERKKRRASQVEFEVRLTSEAFEARDDIAASERARSKLCGKVIWVAASHPDFLKRCKRTRLGKEHFDDRLLSYLATLVAAHYRDLAYQQMDSQPDSCKEILDDMVEVYVALEERLRKALPSLLKQLDSAEDGGGAVSPLQRRRWRGLR